MYVEQHHIHKENNLLWAILATTRKEDLIISHYIDHHSEPILTTYWHNTSLLYRAIVKLTVIMYINCSASCSCCIHDMYLQATAGISPNVKMENFIP